MLFSFFFFKQKTAYEMRISDWSSDVCSSDLGALVMGHYGDNAANLRLWQIARDFTLCDNFFMGEFGGSSLKHQYLIAEQPPFYPNEDKSPAKGRRPIIEGDDPRGIRPTQTTRAPTSALPGPVRMVRSLFISDTGHLEQKG